MKSLHTELDEMREKKENVNVQVDQVRTMETFKTLKSII